MPALRPAVSALGPRGALPPGGNGSDAAPGLSGEGQQRPRAAVWRHCAQQCAPSGLCSALWAPGVAGFGSQRVVFLSPPPSALAAPEAAAASVRSRWVRAARGPHGCARLLGRRRSLRPGTPSRPVCGSARNSLGLPSAAFPSAFGIEEIYFPGAIFSDDTSVKPIVPALTAPHRAALLRRTDGALRSTRQCRPPGPPRERRCPLGAVLRLSPGICAVGSASRRARGVLWTPFPKAYRARICSLMAEKLFAVFGITSASPWSVKSRWCYSVSPSAHPHHVGSSLSVSPAIPGLCSFLLDADLPRANRAVELLLALRRALCVRGCGSRVAP